MKFSIKPKLLTVLVLAAAALGLMLRVVLYTTCVDEKDLLISGHWGIPALWLLTFLTIGGLALLTSGIKGPKRYRHCYLQSLSATLGCLTAGMVMAVTGIGDLTSGFSSLPLGANILTLLAGLCLLVVGFCRLTGRKPHFLFHVVVCLAFALRMVCLYRDWSSDPQIMDYCFYMGAYLALMLTAYEHAAFACGMGSHRKLWLCSLCALYLCLLSAWNSPAPLLLLASAFWCAADLTSLKIPQRRRRRRIRVDREGL